MAEIIDVANALFKGEIGKWSSISEDDKDKFSFIFNRYFSKKYPLQAQYLNIKGQNKPIVLDMWFYFMKTKPYPNWFWSKSPKWNKSIIEDKDFSLLMKKLKLNKQDDLIYLIENHYDFIKEELDYYKKMEKNGKK